MSISIQKRILSVVFVALMLPVAVRGIVESKAVAQVSKQSKITTDQQQIIEAYRIIAVGIKNRDVNLAHSVYAPEFTQIETNGAVINFEQSRQAFQQDTQNIHQVVGAYFNFKQIQVNGSTATVIGTGNQTRVAVFRKNAPPRFDPALVPGYVEISYDYVPLSIVYEFQETWKRTSSGWKLTNARILNSNVARIPGSKNSTVVPGRWEPSGPSSPANGSSYP